MTILVASVLCLFFLGNLWIFRTGKTPFKPVRTLSWMPKYDPTPERIRGGSIQGMLLAVMGLVVLALVVTFR